MFPILEKTKADSRFLSLWVAGLEGWPKKIIFCNKFGSHFCNLIKSFQGEFGTDGLYKQSGLLLSQIAEQMYEPKLWDWHANEMARNGWR